MTVDPKSVIKKKAADKEQAKKFKTYGLIGLVVIVLFVIFFHAESQANASHSWATNYERKCEACQTMIVSGIWTRSMCASPLSLRRLPVCADSSQFDPFARCWML